MRSVRVGSFYSCFVGLLLFFVHVVFGQGTRDLFDPTQRPVQSRTVPTTTSPTYPPNTPATLPEGSPATTATPYFPNSSGVIPISPSTFVAPIPTDVGGSVSTGIPITMSPIGMSSVTTSDEDAAQQTAERLASVLEEETDDDKEIRLLQMQRQQAEQISDLERRAEALERVTQNEIIRRNWLARRAVDEVGANLFYFPRLKNELLDVGWCQLFDGYTDTGWKVQNSGHYAGGKFTFGQGQIVSDPWKPGMVYTSIPFGDMTLRFDFWAEKDAEVLLLMNTPPNPEDLHSSCYTFVLNSGRSSRPRGLLLGRHGYTLPQLRTMREMWDDPSSEEKGTWHSVRVRIEEGDIQIWLDKRGFISYFEEKPIPGGHVAFLVARGEARFQNIIWQPRQTITVFETEGRSDIPWYSTDGQDLVGSNALGYHLSGNIESKDVFHNYVLQMQYKQGNVSERGGLFVRALPRQENTGYEISLQNFPKRQDREAARGVDAGSFRYFENARYIRAQDMQWTHLTVAVMGRQFATWVDGVPVCEIEDRRTRPAAVGPFLEPGPIRLSVPKENTLFQFRQLTVTPVIL